MDEAYFNERKEKARAIFANQKTIHNPYFRTDIVLNSDGFHHLQFSARRERNKSEQLLKFSLLPLALDVIRKSGTLQEYRENLEPVGERSPRDGFVKLKNIKYWAFIAIVGENKIKIRVILRRVGDGNITFWSVMPNSKISNGKQKISTDGMEDE